MIFLLIFQINELMVTKPVWQWQIQVNDATKIYATLSGDVLYTAYNFSDKAPLICSYDAYSGKRIWSFQIDEEVEFFTAPSVIDSVIFIGALTKSSDDTLQNICLLKIRHKDDKLEWNRTIDKTDKSITTGKIVQIKENRIFLLANKYYYEIESTNGLIINKSLNPETLEIFQKPYYRPDSTAKGYLEILEPTTDKIINRIFLGEEITDSPIIGDSLIYVISDKSGSIFALAQAKNPEYYKKLIIEAKAQFDLQALKILYLNLSLSFLYEKDTLSAIKNYREAMKFADENNLPQLYLFAWVGLWDIYNNEKDESGILQLGNDFFKKFNQDADFRGLFSYDKFVNQFRAEELGDFFLRKGNENLLKNRDKIAREFYEKGDKIYKAIGSYKSNLVESALSFFNIPLSRRYLFTGQYKMALKEFEDELSMDLNNPEQIRYYIITCAVINNFKRAKEFFNILMSRDSLNSYLYYARGLIYECEKNKELALKEYLRAIELDSSNIDAYSNIGLLCLSSDEEYEYLVYKTVKKLKTLYPYKPFQLFALYKITGNLEFLVSALELSPQDPMILSELYRLHKRMEKDTNTIEFIRKAISILRGQMVFKDEPIHPEEFKQAINLVMPNIEELEPFFFNGPDLIIEPLFTDTLNLYTLTEKNFTAISIPKESLKIYIRRWQKDRESLSACSNIAIAFERLSQIDSAKYFIKFADSVYISENKYYERGLFYIALYRTSGNPEMMIRAISSFRNTQGDRELDWCIKNFIADLPGEYSEIEDFPKAKQVFEFFSSFYKENPIELEYEDLRKLIPMFNFTGLNALGMGDIDLSIKAFELYRIFSRRLGADLDFTTANNNLGLACRVQGDFERAITLLREGLKFTEEIAPNDFVGSGFLKGNIAWTYFNMQIFDSAEVYFRMAKAPLESLWQNEQRIQLHSQEVLAFGYAGLGFVNMAEKKYNEALHNFFECIKYADYAGNTFNRSAFGLVYELIGEVYLELNKYDSSLVYLAQSMEYLNQKKEGLLSLEQVIFPSVTMWVMSTRGRIFELQGKNEEAMKYYELSIEILEKFRSTIKGEENRINFLMDKMKLYERMITLLLKLGKYERAFHYVERAKARVLLELLETKMIELPAPEDKNILLERKKIEEKIKDLKEELQKSEGGDEDKIRDLSKNLHSTLNSYDSLLSRIEREKPELASLINVSPVSLSRIQKELNKDLTVLEYYFTDTSIFYFVITKNALNTTETKININNLSNLINYFRSAIMNVDEDAYVEPSMELYKILIAPVAKDLKTEDLIIIPHGLLHYVPFSALMDSNGSFMIDKYNISYLPSASILKFCLEKRDKPKKSIVAFGNPELGNPNLALPSAEEEVKEIGKYYNNSLIFLKQDATEDRCRVFAPDYNIIHFACHGEFNRTDPLSSALLLSGGIDIIDDGRLEAYEIYGIDLKNTRLVVLSACESGLSRITKGDEIIGLIRGFIYAGAPTIIASLWKVSDVSTGKLMASFYNKLNSGFYPAKALGDAERELKNSSDFSHPFFWAPFGLYGYGQ